ncbi:metallophosphoesterase [Vibrio splendidus]|uniref:metallophosphoesterase n=1 Tax=Vibrio splendidus TaxID=29497 RepID=UPI000D3DBDF0|nr:metallophosphoesterase [Vibrio splendidus]PTP42746.1 hypothetical protein CWN87_13015 [Vibrio splendidus]
MSNSNCFTNIHKSFPQNKVGKDYFIGDIHGEYNLIEALLKYVNFSVKDDRLFSVGDLCDRGKDSVACIELSKEKWFHPVIGNHELFVINYNENNAFANKLWKHNGGEWWFSLKKTTQDNIRNTIIENYHILVDVYTEYGLVGMTHANYPIPKWPIDIDELNEDNLKKIVWDRTLLTSKVRGIDLLISGHTPHNTPEFNGFHLNIDTGSGYKSSNAIHNPSLTMCNLQSTGIDFISASTNKIITTSLNTTNIINNDE